jgi:large subunit ribosomal protein L25
MATLKANVRSKGGKGVARKLRVARRIPAVAYGHGIDGRSLDVDAHELEILLAAINPETTIINLQIDGAKAVPALIREVQRHPSRPQILHVDFFQVKAGEKLHVHVPIRFHGAPVGVRDEGGVLHEELHELHVECLPSKIPAEVDVDLTGLHMGHSIHVSDVKVAGATILNDPELVICTVKAPAVPVLETAAAPEPEPVKAKKADAE